MKIKITNTEQCGLGSASIRVTVSDPAQDVIIGAGGSAEIDVPDDGMFAGITFRMAVRKKFSAETGERLPDVNELPPDVPRVVQA